MRVINNNNNNNNNNNTIPQYALHVIPTLPIVHNKLQASHSHHVYI